MYLYSKRKERSTGSPRSGFAGQRGRGRVARRRTDVDGIAVHRHLALLQRNVLVYLVWNFLRWPANKQSIINKLNSETQVTNLQTK